MLDSVKYCTSLPSKLLALYCPPFGSELVGRGYKITKNRNGFNGKEKDEDINAGDYDFGARIYDGRLGRWSSIDPMWKGSVSYTPYHFGANSPVLTIDIGGNENMIYLVILPGAMTVNGGKFTIEDVNNLVKTANEKFMSMGLNTRVGVFNHSVSEETFDVNKLDGTDATAVLGNVNEVKSFIARKVNSYFVTDGDLKNWEGGADNPEKSENVLLVGGNTIALDATGISDCTNEYFKSTTKSELGALSIMHGAGHNAICNHFNDASPEGVDNSSDIMMKGEEFSRASYNDISIWQFTNIENNVGYIEHMKSRFGPLPAFRGYEGKQYPDIWRYDQADLNSKVLKTGGPCFMTSNGIPESETP